jgi:predicted DNA-binding transcriptional regulator AlpA
MMRKSSPFVLPREADEICLISDITRWRQEKRGLFPKRIKLDGKKVAWRRIDIEEWAADPEGWRARNASQGKVA